MSPPRSPKKQSARHDVSGEATHQERSMNSMAKKRFIVLDGLRATALSASLGARERRGGFSHNRRRLIFETPLQPTDQPAARLFDPAIANRREQQ